MTKPRFALPAARDSAPAQPRVAAHEPKAREQDRRCVFANGELSHQQRDAIAAARMDPRHAHLDAWLDSQ